MPGTAPTVQFRSTAPVLRRLNLSTWSATMNTYPIDARPSFWLIAAFVLIVGLGVLGAAADVRAPSGLMQVPSIDAVAQFGD